MRKIRLGHIGVLHDHSSAKLQCVRKYPDIFEVVGVVAETKELEEKCKNQPAYRGIPFMSEEELFAVPGLDAVLVEGYELNLLNIAKRCVDRGIHIHLDKPAGNDLELFRSILDEAAEKNLVIQLAYMYRYNTAIQHCLKMYKNGQMGKLTGIDTAMCTHHSKEKIKWLENFKGGTMFFIGCHMVDLIYMFAGKPKNIVRFNQKTHLNGNDAEDTCLAVFEYDDFSATIRMNSTEVNGFGRRQFVLCGEEATVEIRPLEGPTMMRVSTREMCEKTTYQDKYMNVPPAVMAGRYDSMMMDFARMVTEGKENPFSFEYEYELQKLVLYTCGYDVDWK